MVVPSAIVNSTAQAVRRNTELIIGPYRAGKTTLLLNQILDYCQNNPLSQSLIVVPSHRYRKLLEKRLRKLYAERSSKKAAKGFVGLRIISFQNLCEQILRRAGKPFKVVHQNVRPILVAKCMQRLAGEGLLKHSADLVSFAGSQQSVLELIDEFERAGLTPTDIFEQLKLTSQADSRHMELAQIYAAYLDELKTLGLTDEKGLAFAARELLHSGDLRMQLGFVAVDGFDRFNTLQLQIIGGLSNFCHHLKVCFDYLLPQQDAAQEYIWKEVSFQELSRTLAANAKVKHLVPETAFPEPKLVKFRAVDRQFEFDHVAAMIKERMRQERLPASEFIVVVRNVKPYRSAIAGAFKEAGVPYFLDEPISLIALPLVRLLVGLLSLAEEKFARQRVIECLRSPYFNLAAFGFSRSDVEALDQLSLNASVVETKEQWQEIWTKAGEQNSFDANLSERLFAFFEAVTPPSPATYHEFVGWAEDISERCLLPLEQSQKKRTHSAEEERVLAEFRKVLATLVHEENILGPIKHPASRLLARLIHLVERSNFRRIPEQTNCVVISSADFAPNLLVEEVFIAGLVDGEFPKRGVSHGLVSSEEIALWTSFGINLHNPRFHSGFELALFNSLKQRAKSRVHLSCALSDIGGDELTPSFFLTEGAGDFDKACPVVEPFAHSLSRPVSGRQYLSALAWHRLNSAENYHPSVRDAQQKIEAPLTAALARSLGGANSSLNGYLCEYVATNTISVPLPKKWSASRLTEYGKCPFRYWLAHVLKVKPHEEPDMRLSDKVLGETYHKAMEIFYSELLRRGIRMRPASQEICKTIFADAIGQAVNWLELQPETRPGEFWKFNLAEIKFRLLRFFEHEFAAAQADPDGYEPTQIEATFGFDEEGSFPALKLSSEEGDIHLCGKIDRIDLAADGARARVIDYKKGSANITDEDALSGRNMQLPIYALATERAIMPGIKVVEAKYLSVSGAKVNGTHYFDGRKKPRAKVGETPPDIAGTAEQNVKQFVSSIKKGDFALAPSSPSVCITCSYKSVCRLNEMMTQGKGESPCQD